MAPPASPACGFGSGGMTAAGGARLPREQPQAQEQQQQQQQQQQHDQQLQHSARCGKQALAKDEPQQLAPDRDEDGDLVLLDDADLADAARNVADFAPHHSRPRPNVVDSDDESEEEEQKAGAVTLIGAEPLDEALVQELLEQHGSPKDRIDQIKTLQEIMLDSERDICIFAGAIELLNNQIADSKATSCCSVCARSFQSPTDYSSCLDQLEIKRQETEAVRDECEVIKIYNTTKLALANFEPAKAADQKFESRVSFNMRSGALTELRNQKAECLQNQRCFACQRSFDGGDLIEYLRRVDRNAYQMQERLHVHH